MFRCGSRFITKDLVSIFTFAEAMNPIRLVVCSSCCCHYFDKDVRIFFLIDDDEFPEDPTDTFSNE